MSLLMKGREILSFITSIVILVFVLILLGYLLYSVVYVAPYMDSSDFMIPIYILVGVPLLLFWLLGLSAFVWYSLLVLIISLSGFLILYFGALPYYSNFFKNPFNGKDFSFKQLGEVYALNLFFSVLVVFLMRLINYTPTTPGIGEYPLYSQILLLVHASVYEEIVTRLVYLGLPLYIIYAMRGRKLSGWNIFGGYGKVDNVAAVFMVISALLFAFAHVPSWSWWKMIPTFVGGLVLAYLYVKYGIHASIMLHFMIDFLSIPMSFSPIWELTFTVFIIFFIVAGLFFFISFSHRAVLYFTGKKEKEEEKPREEEVHPWINLRCPNCGGDVFQFVDEETLRCLNCGTEIKIEKKS